jgi:ABC-type transport system involved in multi-copper enzyme maturation permease subunit
MRLWLGLLAAEFAKLRRLVVLRAVAGSLLVGPAVIILVLRLVASDITRVVRSPLEVVLGSVVLMAGFGGVVLAASLLGREFDLGTTRAQLLRGAPRTGLLLAKAAAALLTISAASLLASAVAVAETLLVGWGTTVSQAGVVLARTVGLTLLVSLAYTGATFLGAILGRSSAAGMLAGLALFLGDFLLSTLRTPSALSEWLPVASLLTLLGGTFAALIPSERALTTGAAVQRLLILGGVLLFGAVWLFHRQDATD